MLCLMSTYCGNPGIPGGGGPGVGGNGGTGDVRPEVPLPQEAPADFYETPPASTLGDDQLSRASPSSASDSSTPAAATTSSECSPIPEEAGESSTDPGCSKTDDLSTHCRQSDILPAEDGAAVVVPAVASVVVPEISQTPTKGWRRLLVNTSGDQSKPSWSVHFVSPEGTRFHSLEELSRHLAEIRVDPAEITFLGSESVAKNSLKFIVTVAVCSMRQNIFDMRKKRSRWGRKRSKDGIRRNSNVVRRSTTSSTEDVAEHEEVVEEEEEASKSPTAKRFADDGEIDRLAGIAEEERAEGLHESDKENACVARFPVMHTGVAAAAAAIICKTTASLEQQSHSAVADINEAIMPVSLADGCGGNVTPFVELESDRILGGKFVVPKNCSNRGGGGVVPNFVQLGHGKHVDDEITSAVEEEEISLENEQDPLSIDNLSEGSMVDFCSISINRPISADVLEIPQDVFCPAAVRRHSSSELSLRLSTDDDKDVEILASDDCEDEIVSGGFLDEVCYAGPSTAQARGMLVSSLRGKNISCCTVPMVDLFHKSPLQSFLCLGCSRPYCSTDEFTVDFQCQTLTIACSHCSWWTSRRISAKNCSFFT